MTQQELKDSLNEFSQEFDILYNQVNSNQSASIDEYEKSVFLTKAQDEIVLAYFDPRGNKFVEGFDNGQKRQYDFSSLVVNDTLERYTGSDAKYDPRSYVYMMPKDLFLTLNESVYETVNGVNYIYQIIPISFEQYHVLMQKPYQYPTKRAVWRLITNQIKTASSASQQTTQTTAPNDAQQNTASSNEGTSERGGSSASTPTPPQDDTRTLVEIIGKFNGNYSSRNPEYRMRYVKRPTPIILVNLRGEYNNLSIDGKYGDEAGLAVYDGGVAKGIPCYLPKAVHKDIIQRAVELATAVYNPQALGTIAGVGNVSSTNLGIVPRQEGK